MYIFMLSAISLEKTEVKLLDTFQNTFLAVLRIYSVRKVCRRLNMNMHDSNVE